MGPEGLFWRLRLSDRKADTLAYPFRENPRNPRIRVGPALAQWAAHHMGQCALHCTRHLIMDIERTNAIGTLLADLSARTEALRGYL